MAAKKTSSIFASLKNDLEAQKAEEKEHEEDISIDSLEFETSEEENTATTTAEQRENTTIVKEEPVKEPQNNINENQTTEKITEPTVSYKEPTPEISAQPAKKTSILAGAKNRTVRVPRSLALTQEADAKIQMLKKKYDLSLNEIINRIILAYED